MRKSIFKRKQLKIQYFIGDEFWKSIEPYYMEGKWTYPKGRQVLAELSNDAANKALGEFVIF